MENKKTKILEMAAFILGILSLVSIVLIWILGGLGKSSISYGLMGACITFGIIGMIAGIVGVILAITIKKSGETSIFATLGLVFSCIGLVMCTISLIGCLSCTTCSAYSKVRQINKTINNSVNDILNGLL